MTLNYTIIGEQIRKARKKMKITQEQLAEMVDKCPSYISYIENGKKKLSLETLVNIAKDVWKFDLNQNEEDLKTVELYVKPEEGLCYYVFNGDVTGNFVI